MANKGPNTAEDGLGTGKGQKLTPEQMAENDRFDLGPHLIRLYWEEPFFSTFYRRMHRIMNRTSVPTAGVCIVNGRPTLLWNQDFVAGLPPAQIMGLLKHEVYHLIYDHVTDRAQEPFLIWNWAADLSINAAIPRKELPEGGLIPGEPLKMPEKERWDEMTPEEQERHQNLSSLIESMDKNLMAEEYFSMLMNDPEVQKMQQEAEEAKKQMEEMLSEALKDALGGMDSHEGWGQKYDENGNPTGEAIGDGDRQLLEGELKEALKDAIREADGSNSWGSVPSKIQQQLRDMVSREVDWRAVLRQFVGMSRRANSRNSRKRVNRKVPYTFPGRTRNYTANVAVYVDQSGSVDTQALMLLYGELRSLAKRTTFHFFPFDTEVDVENGFVWKKGQSLPNLDRFRAGGTNFQACVDHLNDNMQSFDGGLILTDGECSQPSPSRARLGYVIVPGRKLFFEPRPGEILIQMTGNKGSE